MSSARCRWALASTSISVALVAATVAAADPQPRSELELAREPQVYLRLDPATGTLEVKARGMVLEAVPVTGVAWLGYRPARGAAEAPAVELPAVWTVEEDLAEPFRQRIAPSELSPFAQDDGRPPAGSRPANPETAEGPAAAEERPPTPARFRVRLDRGWVLEVSQQLPERGLAARFATALELGWRSLRGHPLETPERLALALTPEAARRLHHLLRPGTRLLVAPPAPEDPAATGTAGG